MTDQSPSYHYQVIGRALQVIDAEGPALTLDDLAAKMNMSPSHFQRVFSQWVGVSPKRYQQYLTLTHARRLLAERHTLLGTALETGLSGTGRLHDLFLTWEAMSPGDYARGGAGLEIRWGWFESPFGPALVMATGKGICGMGFADEVGAEAALEDLVSRWPRATMSRTLSRCAPWSRRPSAGRPPVFTSSARRSRSRSGRRSWPYPAATSRPMPTSPPPLAIRRPTAPSAPRSGGTRSAS
jgi:AraC family transcriptional regulator, regulatory protein of adaptative response / methylated-DNA-[protein]-cysteine methyltransferase